ncbi:MAG: IS3 family transposase, partial [Aristaeellaceae bacterium]
MRQEHLYAAIRDCHAEFGYPVEAACRILHVSRAAYYRWAAGRVGNRTRANEQIAEVIEQIHDEFPDKGYRRIRDDLERYHGIHANDKRVLRICRAKSIQSTIKYANHGCTRHAPSPQHIAENILNRQFHADKP